MRRPGGPPGSTEAGRGFEALAAACREQAEICVRDARRSENLRDIVRLSAKASTLDRVARKLHSATDVSMHDISRVADMLPAPYREHKQAAIYTSLIRSNRPRRRVITEESVTK